jgi:hypothetical protein
MLLFTIRCRGKHLWLHHVTIERPQNPDVAALWKYLGGLSMYMMSDIVLFRQPAMLRMLVAVLLQYDEKRDGTFTAFLTAPQRRSKVLLVLWIVSVFIFFLLSALACGISHALGNIRWGIGLSVFFAAVWLGATALLFLSSKAIVTLFGAFLGMSLSEVSSANGLISLLNQQISTVAHNIGVIVPSQGEGASSFVMSIVWMFVLVFSLMCLPAFFKE